MYCSPEVPEKFKAKRRSENLHIRSRILYPVQRFAYLRDKSKAPVSQLVNTKCSTHRWLIFERPFVTKRCGNASNRNFEFKYVFSRFG